MADKPKTEAKPPKIDFEKISEKLKNLEDRNHLNQIGPSVTDAYISMAKYTDDKGIVRYKTKFKPEEAEKLADKVYDEFIYHTHHRYFNADKTAMSELKKIKDDNGNSYVDTVVKHHFNIDRNSLKSNFKSIAESGDSIDDRVISAMLKDPIQHHAGVITSDILKDVRPEDMDTLKAYIKELGTRHGIEDKVINRANKTYDIQSLIKQYMQIVQDHYSVPKKKAA